MNAAVRQLDCTIITNKLIAVVGLGVAAGFIRRKGEPYARRVECQRAHEKQIPLREIDRSSETHRGVKSSSSGWPTPRSSDLAAYTIYPIKSV